MCDLNQVVQLDAPTDDSGLHHGAVDGGIGADLHLVFEHHVAQLRDLAVGAIFRCEPEAVRADDGAGVQDAA